MTATTAPARNAVQAAATIDLDTAKVAVAVETSQGVVKAVALPKSRGSNLRRYLVLGVDGTPRAVIRGGAGRYVIEGSDYNTSANPYLDTLTRVTVSLALGADVL